MKQSELREKIWEMYCIGIGPSYFEKIAMIAGAISRIAKREYKAGYVKPKGLPMLPPPKEMIRDWTGYKPSNYVWRRRRVQVALLSVVVGLLIVGSLYGLWEWLNWVHGR